MPKFMKSLNNISRCQAAYRMKKMSADGLCASHHAFVLAICRFPGRSQEEISREICLNKSTVARVINHLEEQGYVRREAAKEDKRRFLVFPTDKMLLILPQVRKIAREWNSLITADIPQEEMAVFHSVLSRIEKRAKIVISEGEM